VQGYGPEPGRGLANRRHTVVGAVVAAVVGVLGAFVLPSCLGADPGGPSQPPVPPAVAEGSETPATPSDQDSPTSVPEETAGAVPTGPGVPADPGVSTWEMPGLEAALRDVGVSWYWNWDAGPTPGAGDSVEFVPMIWGAGSVTADNLARARRNGTVLLGFNEPDFASQANMTVEQALDLWPQLQATGMRLGSPAPAVGAADPGGWLDRFMAGAAQRGYRVDFIVLHWYGGDFGPGAVGHLRSYLEAVWERYRRPIWLTEFALIRWEPSGAVYPSDAELVQFIEGATRMLEELSFVERYSWFALPTFDGRGTGLYYDGATPTAAGAAYRQVGR
jgi:hypothetical protein